jgi:hypothetical protein
MPYKQVLYDDKYKYIRYCNDKNKDGFFPVDQEKQTSGNLSPRDQNPDPLNI